MTIAHRALVVFADRARGRGKIPPTVREACSTQGHQAMYALYTLEMEGWVEDRRDRAIEFRCRVLRHDVRMSLPVVAKHYPRETWPLGDAVTGVRLYSGALHFEIG